MRKVLMFSLLRRKTNNTSNTSNNPKTKLSADPVADDENPFSLSPEEIAEAMSYKTKWQTALSLSEAVERRASELVKRSRREAVFHESDILAGR